MPSLTKSAARAVPHLAVVLDELDRMTEMSDAGTYDPRYAEAHHAQQQLREALIALGVPAEDVFDYPDRLPRAAAM